MKTSSNNIAWQYHGGFSIYRKNIVEEAFGDLILKENR